MAKRNVVDFRIVNIPDDDAFKQLEEQGKVDPNAMYVSPDTSLKEKHITNCITEIPQDIKLELNNGTLTLKAGSKVYVPNGVGVFDVRDITVDRTYTQTTDGQYLLLARQDTSIWGCIPSLATSGTTPPTGTGTFYNTETNSIDFYNNGTYNERHYSFPFALITVSNGAISSIDQVFNGFGYIGSTAFALPGVKALAPNGRNEDGTLKNRTITISAVLTTTDTSGATGAVAYYINGSGIYRANIDTRIYDEYKNIFVHSAGFTETLTELDMNAYRTNGRITSFNPKQVFHAVGYSDTEFIAHQATPSDRYIDITLPASGNTLTAPADGYFAVGKNSTASGQRLRMWYRGTNNGDLMSASSWSSGSGNLEISLYVAKGSTVVFVYTADGTTNYCRFIYANGAK